MCAPSAALAHGTTIPHDLAGVSLCVDDATVAVAFAGPGGEVRSALVHERLERAVHGLLDAGGVTWRREAVCPPGRGYVSVVLDVRDASWFEPRASEYLLMVRVGWRAEAGDRVRADPPDAFDFAAVELFDERAVGVPAFVYLPRYAEAGLRDLTVSWWEDQPPAGAVPAWVPWAGGVLALAVAAGTAAALRRRRQGMRAGTRIIPHARSHRRHRQRPPAVRLPAAGRAGVDGRLDRR